MKEKPVGPAGLEPMTGRIAIFSPGLMKLRHEIKLLSGLEPRFAWSVTASGDAVAGWGHKPSAARARAAAMRSNRPYIAFEDGFLRSLLPGSAQRPSAMVMDRSGIYYDARQPSDLEMMLETASFTEPELADAKSLLELIARHRLSKYNHGADRFGGRELPPGRELVVIIDQTAGDESVAGAMADAAAFIRMAEAAVAENPAAQVIARLHPETLNGTKPGYLLETARRLGLKVSVEHVTPWALFDRQPHVYTVSSQFGFEALLAGCKVTCFGMPFYAGWGLTDDRAPRPKRRTRTRTRLELAAAVYLRYSRYFDTWFREPVDAARAVDQLAFLRRNYLSNAQPVTAYRIARWKRRAVSAMLLGPSGPPRFLRRFDDAVADAKTRGAAIAAWGIDSVRLRPRIESHGLACLAIEDGFLRSVGLGAAFVQPVSLVFDSQGLYFDPTGPSDIETLLATGNITGDDTDRAHLLRQRIVAERITKYNVVPAGISPDLSLEGRSVLVPGQVADDWAVLVGRPQSFPPDRNVNAVLLEQARRRHPRETVIFKPHPDVEQLGRAGALDDDWLMRHADVIARNVPIDQLLQTVSHVETYSSLAGFEALLRGIKVSVHGMPFYAGWGLTDDVAVCLRRGRRRSLDELVAAALIRYPRYWDSVSGLACPPEAALRRIAEMRSAPPRVSSFAGVIMGKAVIVARRLLGVARRTGP